MRANAADLVRRAAGKPIRVASKSIRSRALLEHILAMDGFRGVMAYTLPEALWLAAGGITDILVAYPHGRPAGAGRPGGGRARRRADHRDRRLGRPPRLPGSRRGPGAPARRAAALPRPRRAAYVAFGRRVGALRSPVREPHEAADLAADIAKRPGFRLVGLLAYEAQIAGVGDAPPSNAARARLIRLMQALSARELVLRRGPRRERRTAVRRPRVRQRRRHRLRGAHHAREKAITELAAGSGFFHPRLFDFYRRFTGRPAALFALPVVRRPAPDTVTVLGGGYLASGPVGPARAPQPYLPAGLRYAPEEGAGEVQTPLLGQAAGDLRLGDRVWFRHAKAGELCEHFDALHLVDGDTVVEPVPTYRGEGRTFL
ncbi:amino acid deaminase/aldolase [Nonomuraea rubra]|uniref:amino acid deaminase/aldolase n=1 Tax=Nonomuraea rubra TaxID=46180 RepID=UPI003385E21F